MLCTLHMSTLQRIAFHQEENGSYSNRNLVLILLFGKYLFVMIISPLNHGHFCLQKFGTKSLMQSLILNSFLFITASSPDFKAPYGVNCGRPWHMQRQRSEACHTFGFTIELFSLGTYWEALCDAGEKKKRKITKARGDPFSRHPWDDREMEAVK